MNNISIVRGSFNHLYISVIVIRSFVFAEIMHKGGSSKSDLYKAKKDALEYLSDSLDS